MSRTVAIIQARMTSTRLPGKVLLPLAGQPLIRRVVERATRIPGVDAVAVALAEGSEHDPIADVLSGTGTHVARGPEHDVLARTAIAVRETRADTVVRITSDCPLIDPHVSGAVLAAHLTANTSGVAYARTQFDRGFPLGFDTEAFPASLLFEAERVARDPYEREHVTPYIWRNPDRFPTVLIDALPDRRHWRLVVDTREDYALCGRIYDLLHPANPEFGYSEIAELLTVSPSLLETNRAIEQNPYVGRPADTGASRPD